MTSAIRMEAKPAPITLNLAETAVLVVDMQNDFGSEGGMFHRAAAGGCSAEPIRQDLPRSNHDSATFLGALEQVPAAMTASSSR